MKFSFTQCLLTCWAIISLSGCQDHKTEPGTQRLRLKRIIQQTSQLYFSYSFTYNGDNKIASYSIHNGFDQRAENAPGPITTLQYDAQGRLLEAITQPLADFGNGSKRTYQYNSVGNLTSASYYNARMPGSGYGLAYVYQVGYDATNSPNKITAEGYLETGEKAVSALNLYTYSGGNVTKQEVIYSAPNNTLTETYQYDDKANPYYGLAPVIGLGGQRVDPIYLSKNNPIDDLTKVEYDSNGLLVKRVVALSSNPSVQTTYTYEYESY
ncbi:RHS repeat domain-containing protein [Spirosoma utsteinense]|uniref:YD repeat-containing protein n=1 Tax=Spirosoma utsteinense TaxID=2585773 RepID=A0ABR6WEY1_9BACT|nr:RHS repeat domain-containing protein [Spirosoma utsteinense]MBC3789149.1 hypothetical protein [Spirosoma utsteinense]MBC3795069.1 hypothetical protein [Spirosoma utsteinense]